jgi:uncharacterized UPF0160 family protein
MNQTKVLRSFGTHDGQFHSDEVTACAFLLMFDLIDEDQIVRTRDAEKLRKCEFVCDVGGEYDPSQKLFDHHQAKYDGHLSSAGMILLYLKDQGVINQCEYNYFNDYFVYGVDAHDNGRDPLPIGFASYSDVVGNYVPIPYEVPPAAMDEAFFQALHFAVGHISRLWERYHYAQSCREIVAKAMKNSKEYIIFEKSIPWMDLFFELGGEKHPAQFVVIPSGGHWNLRGIPPTLEDRLNVRMPLPEEWAGLLNEDLKKATGILGAIFCHKGRFISVWETKEDALAALEYVMSKELK